MVLPALDEVHCVKASSILCFHYQFKVFLLSTRLSMDYMTYLPYTTCLCVTMLNSHAICDVNKCRDQITSTSQVI